MSDTKQTTALDAVQAVLAEFDRQAASAGRACEWARQNGSSVAVRTSLAAERRAWKQAACQLREAMEEL